MEILKKESGILVIKQFEKIYLRFMAGGISDKLYQLEISQKEYNMIMNSEINSELIINKYMNEDLNLQNKLEDRIIFDYLSFVCNYTDNRKKKIIEKLHKYGDIYTEFYYYVLTEKYEDGVEESGYCASKLVNQYSLSSLGAYNYLIYLRENPKEAIADLKRGLPRK